MPCQAPGTAACLASAPVCGGSACAFRGQPAARAIAPAGLEIEVGHELGRLPLYDQDTDTSTPPAPVVALRERIAAADALLIATPEHNASVPAVLKNALDWASTAPDGLLHGKPVAIAGASPGPFGTVRAQLALRQILTHVGADVVAKPDVTVFRCDTRFTADGALTDALSTELLRDLLAALARKIAAAAVHCSA